MKSLYLIAIIVGLSALWFKVGEDFGHRKGNMEGRLAVCTDVAPTLTMMLGVSDLVFQCEMFNGDVSFGIVDHPDVHFGMDGKLLH